MEVVSTTPMMPGPPVQHRVSYSTKVMLSYNEDNFILTSKWKPLHVRLCSIFETLDDVTLITITLLTRFVCIGRSSIGWTDRLVVLGAGLGVTKIVRFATLRASDIVRGYLHPMRSHYRRRSA